MDPLPPGRVLTLVAAGTRYHIFIPENQFHPPDGTTFMIDLVCTGLEEDWLPAAQRAMEIVFFPRSRHELAQSSDYQWFERGSRFYRYLYVFLLPLRPPDLHLHFRIPVVRLRFFPANEDRLPLSH